MNKHISNRWTLPFLALVLAGSPTARGATLTEAQTECRSIAQQQAGGATAPTQPQAGGRARGAAAGAMAGLAKGKSKSNQYGKVPNEVAEEYTRNQMEDAAKMGVAAGASRQRQQRRQNAASQQQSSSAYNQAYSACMAGKGYPGQ